MRISNLYLNLVSGEQFWFLYGCYRPNLTPNLNLWKVTVHWKIFIFCPNFPQIALLNPFNFSHFKNVLIFGMGWAVWIFTCPLQMDRQTDVQTYSSNYNIDIKGHGVVKNLHFWSDSFASSFITWQTVWEFEICAYFLNTWIGFDFYRQLTDRLLPPSY